MVTSLFDLTGKVAIVTGGAMGIGKRLAHALAEQGANVVIADIAEEPAEQVAGELAALGVQALAVKTDVCDPDEVDRMVAAAVRRFGTVDILVNNAGGRKSRPAETPPFKVWQEALDLNLTSAFLCAYRVSQVMAGQNGGKIVNIASVYGLVGRDASLYDDPPDYHPIEMLAYSAAKGGIVSLTRALAVELARAHINVNAIAPGMVQTERVAAKVNQETWDRLSKRTPARRPAQPEELKGAVVYLASAASDFVTGHTLVVDGGWVAW